MKTKAATNARTRSGRKSVKSTTAASAEFAAGFCRGVTPIAPKKAWALVDSRERVIDISRIYHRHTKCGGRGSITEGWLSIPVMITPIVRKKGKR